MTDPKMTVMCPHCGEIVGIGDGHLTDYHDWPKPIRQVCPGSKQHYCCDPTEADCTCIPGQGCDEEGDPGCAYCRFIDCEWPCPSEVGGDGDHAD